MVTNWLQVGHHLVVSDDQVGSRPWWVAGGSRHTFVEKSPDECARGVSHLKLVLSSHSSINTYLSCPDSVPSQSPPGSLHFFLLGVMHILKSVIPPREKGSLPGGSPIPYGIMNILKKALWPLEKPYIRGRLHSFLKESFFSVETGVHSWRHSSIP